MARRATKAMNLMESLQGEPWPDVDVDALAPDQRDLFVARRRAVDAYLGGESTLQQIQRDTGIATGNILRLAERCVQIHKDGRIWGYRALIGYQRISEYHRRAPIVPDPSNPSNNTGLAGAFGYLLGHHPQLQQFIEDLYLKRKRGHSRIIHETKITTERLHKRFLDECRRLGIKEDEYPFTQREQGLRSLYEYIRTLKETNMIAAVRARGRKEDAQLLNDIGTGPSPIRPTRPFQSIEFDGHHLDMHMTIEIPSPHGFQFVLIKRIWLLVILDLYSEAVLGYHISLNFEYNRYDILRCILYALTPPPVAPQIIEDLSFPQNGRVPNDVFPELHWTAWDEQKLDNAMAHRATVA